MVQDDFIDIKYNELKILKIINAFNALTPYMVLRIIIFRGVKK
jgi:hypothetical protein